MLDRWLLHGRLGLRRFGAEQPWHGDAVQLRECVLHWTTTWCDNRFGALWRKLAGVHDVLLPDARELLGRRDVLALHLADRHLAVALVRIGARGFEALRDAANLNHLLAKERPLETTRIALHKLLRVTVEQLELQIAPVGRQHEQAAVGVDGFAFRPFGQIEHRHAPHLVRARVAAIHAQVELVGQGVEHLIAQGQRGFGAGDILLQNAQLVVGARQDLIVERHHGHRQQKRADEHGQHQGPHADPIGLERRNLVFGRHATEREERGHQHRHGQRHGDGEWQRQEKKLDDGAPGQPFAGQIGQLARDVLQHEQRRQRAEREHERADVLAHDVAGNKLHDVNSVVSTCIIKGVGAVGCMNRA